MKVVQQAPFTNSSVCRMEARKSTFVFTPLILSSASARNAVFLAISNVDPPVVLFKSNES